MNHILGKRRTASRGILGRACHDLRWRSLTSATRAYLAVLLWLLVSLFLVEFLILLPSVDSYRNDLVAERVDREGYLIGALIERAPEVNLKQLLDSQSMVQSLELWPDGGTQRIEIDGEVVPDAAAASALLGRPKLEGSHIDAAWDVETPTGPAIAVARIGIGDLRGQVRGYIWRILGLVLLLATAVAFITSLAMRRYILKPLRQQATHDALTGLPNRTLFDDRLAQCIAHSHRYKELAAVLFVDLDRFKDFNDNFGHAAGDELLVDLSKRIRAAVRDCDTAARLGGDEFGIVMTRIRRPDDARHLSQRLLDAVSGPYVHRSSVFHVRASVGVALIPNHGSTAGQAMRHADIAMFEAKRAGRARVVMFDAQMSAQVGRRKQLEDWMRIALASDHFELHYQPKIAVSTGALTGAEALLRWPHGEDGMISPEEFIPVAEESGLIIPLGQWVLDEACAQIAAWTRDGIDVPQVAVNVSAPQLMAAGYAKQVAQTMQRHQVSADQLELEVTESMLMKDPDTASATLGELRALGLNISVDDFGTGYSSLSYLKQFPISGIKVDRSFVMGLQDAESSDASIIQAVISMGHSMRTHVVAEGVETAQQRALLRAWGCDQIQGYLVSRAVDRHAFEQWLLQWPPAERTARPA